MIQSTGVSYWLESCIVVAMLIYAYYSCCRVIVFLFNQKNKKETSLIRSVLLFFLSNSYKRYLHYNDTNTFFFHDVKLPVSLLNILDL